MAENIASLQKVALVHGFGYQESKELATKYPFALKHPRMSIYNRSAQFAPFAALTGHSESIKETARLTDEQIEDMEYPLKEIDSLLYFNYETGLLSIGDKYVLNDINLIKLSYIPFFETNEVDVYNENQGGDFIIDAKDNKFKIEFRFITDDEDEAKYISKELSFGYNEYIQYVGYNENSLGTIGSYYFNVLKNKTNSLNVSVKSTYVSNITKQITLSNIKLNPQYLHIYEDGINIDNKDTLTLNYDDEINLKAILSCDVPNAVFNNFDIRININNMASFINVIPISASSNEATFNIKCANIEDNASLNGSFDINVYRDNILVSHLSKHYRIEVHGEYNNALWYIGNKDIKQELLSQNDLNKIEGTPGIDIQNYSPDTYYEDTLYFIISDEYDGIKHPGEGKVRPCNNFYTIDNTNNQKFVSAANWVEEYTSIEINGITFNAYRFKDNILYENKFYGKIQ